MVQILQELKRLGLVVSTRGAGGGYRLARERRRITISARSATAMRPQTIRTILASMVPFSFLVLFQTN